jgi:hypothetical protein
MIKQRQREEELSNIILNIISKMNKLSLLTISIKKTVLYYTK